MGRSAALSGAKRIKSIDPFSASHGFVDADRGRIYNNAPGTAAREASRLPRKLRMMLQLQRASVSHKIGSRPRAPPNAIDAVGDRRPGEPLAAFKRRVYSAAAAEKAATRVPSLHGISAKRKAYYERRKGEGEGDDDVDGVVGGGGGEGDNEKTVGSALAATSGGGAASGGGTRGAISAKPVWVSKADAADALARDVAAAAVFADTFGTDVSEFSAAVAPADAARAAKRARADDVAGGGVAKRVDVSSRAEAPRFGERVEAPPRLTVKPRMPKAERQAASIQRALAPKQEKAPKLDKRAREAARAAMGATGGRSGASGAGVSGPPAPPLTAARSAVLDTERDAARAAFAAMKVRRREAFAAAATAAAKGASGALRLG